jgi:hypothetical protein
VTDQQSLAAAARRAEKMFQRGEGGYAWWSLLARWLHAESENQDVNAHALAFAREFLDTTSPPSHPDVKFLEHSYLEKR